MTKSKLVEKLAQRYPQLAQKDAEYAANIIFEAIAAALLDSKRIEIRGFGSFRLNFRRPRTKRSSAALPYTQS